MLKIFLAINANPQKIEEVLTRRVVEVLPNKEGLKKLMQKRRGFASMA